MSVSQVLQQYILRNPGQTLRAIAAGIGITDRAGITNAGAQLSQLVKKGKLRAAMSGSRKRGAAYHPTDATGVLLRPKLTPQEVAARAEARAQRKAVQRRAQTQARRQLTDAQRDAFYKHVAAPSPAPRKPTAQQQFKIAAPRRRTATHTGAAQTVEEFIALGGQIERLASHASSHPLRFDHSDNTVPTGKRRPSIRSRGSHRE